MVLLVMSSKIPFFVESVFTSPWKEALKARHGRQKLQFFMQWSILRFWASLLLQYVFFQPAIKKTLKTYIKMFILLHFVYSRQYVSPEFTKKLAFQRAMPSFIYLLKSVMTSIIVKL